MLNQFKFVIYIFLPGSHTAAAYLTKGRTFDSMPNQMVIISYFYLPGFEQVFCRALTKYVTAVLFKDKVKIP